MKWNSAALAFAITAAAFVVAGCSQSTQPVSTQSTTDAAASLTNSIASSEMTLLKSAGINVDGRGLLAISWREMFNPGCESTLTAGRAIAVGFDTAQISGLRRKAIDMGNVFVDYDSTHLELTKHTSHNGSVLYTSSAGERDERSNIPFIGDAAYSFSITGSSGFSALTASITVPPALLNLTNPQKKDTVDSSIDLTLTWNGGNDSSGVVVAVAALPPPFFGKADDDHDNNWKGDRGENEDGGYGMFGGMHHDHHDHGGPGGGFGMPPGGFPPMLDSTRAIIVKLNGNPRTYTVSGAALHSLLTRTGARHVSCSVSQIISNEVTHDGGTVLVAVRNGDGVIVRAK